MIVRFGVVTVAAVALLLALGSPQAAAVGPYSLLVSTSTTRSNATVLAGATVKGSIYVFTSPDTSDIARVRFWLDNPQMTGTPRRSEENAPYDFAGGSAMTANHFSTTGLADGQHTISVSVDFAAGGSEVEHATFTVANEAPPPPCTGADCGKTTVGIQGTDWLLNGSVTYPGRPVEGLLLNARTANAIFDDDNAATVDNWAYPDTGAWDPDRNVREFLANLPLYAAKGLRGVTVSLQGGMPVPDNHPQASTAPWIVSAFAADGSLKPAWMSRLERVLAAADENGVVVILNLFHRHQDQRLQDESAVNAGVDNVVDWLLAHPYRNVVLDVVNETSPRTTSDWFQHPIMRPDRVHELIARVQERSGGRLLASTSFIPIPPDPVLAASDFVLLHGNNHTTTEIMNTVAQIRARAAYQADPKPIIFSEDGHDLSKFNAAVSVGASWGYHDRNGLQFVPVDWRINTSRKDAFFNKVAAYAFG